jgi:ABC-type antimicrobial peptide transport system permease subunit
MNSLDLVKMSFGNLRRRKLRTFLTMLGVVIGTSSIILMLSLGFAMDASFQESLQQMGSLNVIEVRRGGGYSMEQTSKRSPEVRLDDAAVASFRKISGVEAVMPVKNAYLRVIEGKMVGDVNVIGLDPALMEAFDFEVEQGRLLMAGDKEAMVFGKQVAFNFRNPRLQNDPREGFYSSTYVVGGTGSKEGPEPKPPVNLLSDKLQITTDMGYGERRRSEAEGDDDYIPPSPVKIKGVGILKENHGEETYSAYMNITTLEKIQEEERKARHLPRSSQNSEDKYNVIKVKVADIQQVQSIQEQIGQMGYQPHSLTEMLESVNKQFRVIQAILGGIGAVSLLVAAIGITNTMIMSIYERTREIGVIKVLGANLRDIKKMFLLEAGIIGISGGIIGVCCSSLISLGLNMAAARFMSQGMAGATKISVIPMGLVLSAVAFSTLVGLIAGYSPANRAMKLSALDAIRTE